MTNARACSRALDRAEEWLYKSDLYYYAGNHVMSEFCERVAQHFIDLSVRFI